MRAARGVELSTLPRFLAWKNWLSWSFWSQLGSFSTFFGVEKNLAWKLLFRNTNTLHVSTRSTRVLRIEKNFSNLKNKSISVEVWKETV